jgi:hypothetical protein
MAVRGSGGHGKDKNERKEVRRERMRKRNNNKKLCHLRSRERSPSLAVGVDMISRAKGRAFCHTKVVLGQLLRKNPLKMQCK